MTSVFDTPTLKMMIGKKVFPFLIVGALLLPQFTDCMSAFLRDQQAMQCCATSECSPANQSHGCCETMTSAETPRMLVKARASLDVSAFAVVEHEPVLDAAMSRPPISPSFESQQYYPPELYTLHSSLLI